MSKIQKDLEQMRTNLQTLHEAHLKAIQVIVDSKVKEVLTQVQKHCDDNPVELISGMGTWVFKIANYDIVNLDLVSESQFLMLDNDDLPFQEFYFTLEARELCFQLDNFLRDIQGEYNIYPSSFKLKERKR